MRPADLYKFRVTKINKVIDGDSIRCTCNLGFGVIFDDCGSGISVRLDGCDTEESRTRDMVSKKYGLHAKKFVIDFLDAEKIYLWCKGKDKYGRWLGDFKVGSRWLVAELLKRRLAVPYHGQNKAEIKQLHLANRKLVKL